jgi:TetR/AcrR family transcriptional repressor of nem operon
MAREKVFDDDDVLDRAMTVFWAKGYNSTSMVDLTSRMGINKGSLYHSFGSKRELFKRALLRYDIEQRRATLARMNEISDPLEAVDALFALLIKQSLTDVEKKGCMLVNTALEMPHHKDDIRSLVVQGMEDFEAFFIRQLIIGKTTGTVSDGLDVKTAAKGLLTLVVGLRVLARGVFSEASLEAIRSQAMTLAKARQ